MSAPGPRHAFPPGASWLVVGAVAVVLALASFISVLPTFRTQPAGSATSGGGVAAAIAPTNQANPGGGAVGPAPSGGSGAPVSPGAGGPGPASSAAPGKAAAAPGGQACAAGRNGGATDTGVTGTDIQLAATVAESGIAQSFLGEVRYGMVAVVNQVNAGGGICGRKLDLNLVDDGWSAQQGETDIRNFISQGAFALPVVPSSEGLNAASHSGDIDNAAIPVVGTDGMLYSQYFDPLIWPVATSTISTAHIAVLTAYKAGARNFGIVWNQAYHFGKEGEQAFRGAISRLGGAVLKADVGIDPGKTDYSNEGRTFNSQCGTSNSGSGCDMIFTLLEPSTAETWFSTASMLPAKMVTEGPQPLFVDTFGQNCGDPCNNMEVWTGYFPPRPPFDHQSAVGQYVNAVRSVSSSADVDNQFLEGGYDGMLLFVQALKAVGPNLTRASLRHVLDSMTFDSGLSQPLSWQAGNHFANRQMLGFAIQYSGGFNGFQYKQTGWVADPWPTLDHP